MRIFGGERPKDLMDQNLKKMEAANKVLQTKLKHATMALHYLIEVLKQNEIENVADVQKKFENIFEGKEEFEIPK